MPVDMIYIPLLIFPFISSSLLNARRASLTAVRALSYIYILIRALGCSRAYLWRIREYLHYCRMLYNVLMNHAVTSYCHCRYLLNL